MSKEIVTVSNERDSLNKTRIESEELILNLQNQVKSHTAKVKEISELLSAKTQEHAEKVTELQGQIEAQVAEGESLRDQLSAKTSEHELSEKQISEISATLDNRDKLIKKLKEDISTLEQLKPANRALQDRVTDLTKHLRRISSELEDSLEANADAQGRMRDLENQLHDHTVKIRELRRQRGSMPGFGDEDSNDAGRRAA